MPTLTPNKYTNLNTLSKSIPEAEYTSDWDTISIHRGKEAFVYRNLTNNIQNELLQRIRFVDTVEGLEATIIKAETPVAELKEFILSKPNGRSAFSETDIWIFLKRMITCISRLEDSLVPIKELSIDNICIFEHTDQYDYALLYTTIDWSIIDTSLYSFYEVLKSVDQGKLSQTPQFNNIKQNDRLGYQKQTQVSQEMEVLRKLIDQKSRIGLKGIFGTAARIATGDVNKDRQEKQLVSRTSLKASLLEQGYTEEFIKFLLYVLFIRDISCLPTISELNDFICLGKARYEKSNDQNYVSRSGLSHTDYLKGCKILEKVQSTHDLNLSNKLREFVSAKKFVRRIDKKTDVPTKVHMFYTPESAHKEIIDQNITGIPRTPTMKVLSESPIKENIGEFTTSNKTNFSITEEGGYESCNRRIVYHTPIKTESSSTNITKIGVFDVQTQGSTTDEELRNQPEEFFNFKSYIDNNKLKMEPASTCISRKDPNFRTLHNEAKCDNLSGYLKRVESLNKNTNPPRYDPISGLNSFQASNTKISFDINTRRREEGLYTENHQPNENLNIIDSSSNKLLIFSPNSNFQPNETNTQIKMRKPLDDNYEQYSSNMYQKNGGNDHIYDQNYRSFDRDLNVFETPKKPRIKIESVRSEKIVESKDFKHDRPVILVNMPDNIQKLYSQGSDDRFIKLSTDEASFYKKDYDERFIEESRPEYNLTESRQRDHLGDSEALVAEKKKMNLEQRVTAENTENIIKDRITAMWGDKPAAQIINRDIACSPESLTDLKQFNRHTQPAHNKVDDLKKDLNDIQMLEYQHIDSRQSFESPPTRQVSYGKMNFRKTLEGIDEESENSVISYSRMSKLDVSGTSMGDNPVFPAIERIDTPKTEVMDFERLANLNTIL